MLKPVQKFHTSPGQNQDICAQSVNFTRVHKIVKSDY